MGQIAGWSISQCCQHGASPAFAFCRPTVVIQQRRSGQDGLAELRRQYSASSRDSDWSGAQAHTQRGNCGCRGGRPHAPAFQHRQPHDRIYWRAAKKREIPAENPEVRAGGFGVGLYLCRGCGTIPRPTCGEGGGQQRRGISPGISAQPPHAPSHAWLGLANSNSNPNPDPSQERRALEKKVDTLKDEAQRLAKSIDAAERQLEKKRKAECKAEKERKVEKKRKVDEKKRDRDPDGEDGEVVFMSPLPAGGRVNTHLRFDDEGNYSRQG